MILWKLLKRYGVWHITKIYMGEYEEKKETPSKKKQKKEADE